MYDMDNLHKKSVILLLLMCLGFHLLEDVEIIIFQIIKFFEHLDAHLVQRCLWVTGFSFQELLKSLLVLPIQITILALKLGVKVVSFNTQNR
ncbi:hypothetical protein BD560DRAFT_388386 [Blakeslea trispora]|nr:hypothetical protein BD560DRAFT_388386 [Blakeslea trispora]